MNEIEHFDFDGLDESAIGYDSVHGVVVHETKFLAWLGYDVSNRARIEEDNFREGDLLRGVFRPLGRVSSGGRKADALTKRGVRRILMRSNHDRAVEYADLVLDMLDELDRTGMVVDEKRITDEQIETGKRHLDNITRRRLEEKQDYRTILHALKLGGAVSDEYCFVQNTLYQSLFGKSASDIRSTQPQRTGEPLKRGEGFRKSTVAKDFLTEQQLAVLNSTVLATVAQIQLRHSDGATAAEMTDAIHRAISIIQPRRIA